MKKKGFFLSLMAALLFAGCSNDDAPVNIGDENGGYGYVAVNIVQPKLAGTRAYENNAETPDFEDGTENENIAKTGLFFIFDGNGENGTSQSVGLSGDENPKGNEERIYNAVLVINGDGTSPSSWAKQIVCVLNAPDDELKNVKTLQGLREKIANYGQHNENFIMTNSVYMKDDKEILGAPIDESNIKKSAEEANKNPVEVYVERVVAKIKAKFVDFNNTKPAKPSVGGTEKELTIKVTGMEIANIAKQSYLLKNIIKPAINFTWNWNDPTNHRSYWENVPLTPDDERTADSNGTMPESNYENQSYDAIVDGNAGTDNIYKELNLTEFNDKFVPVYVQPNTSDQKTAVLLTAQLIDKKTNKPADLAYICGGYTTEAGAKNIVLQYLAGKGYHKKVTNQGNTTISELGVDDLEWFTNFDLADDDKVSDMYRYEVVAQLKADLKLCDATGNELSIEESKNINKFLRDTKDYRARVFKDGRCYYFVNIDQTPVAIARKGSTSAPSLHTYEGVIRNHIYDLALKSISGVGVPVFDPSEIIIPETPETEEDKFYVAAEIHVLSWRVVSQDVNFDF